MNIQSLMSDRRYLSRKIPHKIRIGLALRNARPHEQLRRDLAIAQSYGIDVRQLFAECVQENLADKPSPSRVVPTFADVDPNASHEVAV